GAVHDLADAVRLAGVVGDVDGRPARAFLGLGHAGDRRVGVGLLVALGAAGAGLGGGHGVAGVLVCVVVIGGAQKRPAGRGGGGQLAVLVVGVAGGQRAERDRVLVGSGLLAELVERPVTDPPVG